MEAAEGGEGRLSFQEGLLPIAYTPAGPQNEQ
jgi:hypothetical protein